MIEVRAQVEQLQRERDEAQAACVALREGLQNARKLLIDGGDSDEDRDWVFEIDVLLADPNPGAKVAAVVEAACDQCKYNNSESGYRLIEAVRAQQETK